jgi:hypothetical protein
VGQRPELGHGQLWVGGATRHSPLAARSPAAWTAGFALWASLKDLTKYLRSLPAVGGLDECRPGGGEEYGILGPGEVPEDRLAGLPALPGVPVCARRAVLRGARARPEGLRQAPAAFRRPASRWSPAPRGPRENHRSSPITGATPPGLASCSRALHIAPQIEGVSRDGNHTKSRRPPQPRAWRRHSTARIRTGRLHGGGGAAAPRLAERGRPKGRRRLLLTVTPDANGGQI